MKRTNRRFASEDILAVEELAEQLADELDINEDVDDEDIVPINEEETGLDAEIKDVEKCIADAELPDDEPVVADEEEEILDEAEELENQIAEAEETYDVLSAAEDLEKQLDACNFADDEEKEKCCRCGRAHRRASEFGPGVEDNISDTANGGDPSVSEIVDNSIDCDTDKEVFGQNTNSSYVARITARLDRVAAALEKRGMRKMAFRIDQLSDKLESRVR